MAQQEISDLLMKFVGDEGLIAGEVGTNVKLRRTAMTDGFINGRMFEVTSFTFKAGLIGEDTDEATQMAQAQGEHATKTLNKTISAINENLDAMAMSHPAGKSGAPGVKSIPPIKGSNSFAGSGFKKFRTTTDAVTYPADLKPVTFERGIDKSSPILLQYCIERRIFKSASLIKRKPTGGPNSGEVFLRFDFNTVLLTSVDWSNDDPVKESLEFVSRAVTIHYLPQLPDGSLGAPIQAFWTATPDLKAAML